MPRTSKFPSFLPFLLLLSLLSACSGGKSTGAPSAAVDPSPAYTGVKTQAKLSQSNGEKVALNGFSGSAIAMDLEGTFPSKRAPATVEADLRLRQVTQAVKESTRRMQLPGIARERLKARAHSRNAKTVSRQATEQTQGPNGGSASFTLEINDSTGSFYGSVTYKAYTSGTTVISGTADLMGTFDVTYQKISRLTLSFKSLDIHVGAATVTLVGSISMAANPAAGAETETINIVWVEAGKSYWWQDLEVATTYRDASRTMTFSGRYYEPDYGYVDIRTATPVVSNNGYSWPSQGSLKFSGGAGTTAELTFQPRKLGVGVDCDGNGSVEWHRERGTNEQAKANSEPVANAGMDQSVIQNALVSLDGSASSDPDGDTLSYLWQFDSCPNNSCPAITDSNTARPSFTPIGVGTYTLHVTVNDGKAQRSDSVAVVCTAAESTDPFLLQQQFKYGTYGTSIGRAGLLTKDLNGDGRPEIIASASAGGFGANSFWYILGYNGSYDQSSWRSENYSSTILRLSLADLTGDGEEDIVVAFTDGTVRVYDPATMAPVRWLSLKGDITAFAVADVDGDGKAEVITSDGIGVRVYSADGVLKWSLDQGGGTSLAVGNVDGDAALEIVTTSYGGKGYVIDGISRTIQWEYINSFGAQVALADLDGDGMAEIVGAAGWSKITVFDADRKTPAWEIATDLDVAALLVKDVDGDGVPDIIYGDGQWGKVHAIDARTHQEKWAVRNPEHGVSGIALDDVDFDGKIDLLWGAGGTSTGADHLYIADPLAGTVKWQSDDFYGMSAIAVGDLDGDGENEIVTVTRNSDSGYSPGLIQVFDARTLAKKAQARESADAWSSYPYIAIADVDGDGKAELVVATSHLYDGEVQIYDGGTLQLRRRSASYSMTACYGLAVADVDKDGRMEIISTAGGKIIVFDDTLQEKWRSVQMGQGMYAVKVADVDGDGNPEIVASIAGGKLAVYDGVTHDLKLLAEVPARAVEVADIDGDGANELLVGRADGIIDVYDGKTMTVRKSVTSFSSASIDALRVADLNGQGSAEWLLGSGGKLTVLGKGGAGLLWRSGNLSGNVGLGNHIAVYDTDGNGRANVIVGSDLVLYDFDRRP